MIVATKIMNDIRYLTKKMILEPTIELPSSIIKIENLENDWIWLDFAKLYAAISKHGSDSYSSKSSFSTSIFLEEREKSSTMIITLLV